MDKKNLTLRSRFIFGILLFVTIITNAQENKDTLKAKDLVYLSFEELMNLKIDMGTLIGMEKVKVPDVNSGSSVAGGYSVFPKEQVQIGLDGNTPLYSDFTNCLKKKNEHFTVALENNHEFPGVMKGFHLESMISWDSENNISGKGPQYYSAEDSVPPEIQSQLAGPNSIRNKHASYSEDELLVRAIAVLDFNSKYKIALGIENPFNRWGPEWGKGAEELRMGDQTNIFSGAQIYLYTV